VRFHLHPVDLVIHIELNPGFPDRRGRGGISAGRKGKGETVIEVAMALVPIPFKKARREIFRGFFPFPSPLSASSLAQPYFLPL